MAFLIWQVVEVFSRLLDSFFSFLSFDTREVSVRFKKEESKTKGER